MKYILILFTLIILSCEAPDYTERLDKLTKQAENYGMKVYRIAVRTWAVENNVYIDIAEINHLYEELIKEIEKGSQ